MEGINTYIIWNIDPEIAKVFGVSLRYYGLLFVTGLILSIVVLRRIFKREEIDPIKLDQLTIYGIAGIFAGARLGHCLFYEPSYYFSHPLEILLPIQHTPDGGYVFTGYQGLASHGGALGLFIALLVFARRTGEPFLRTVDMIAIVGPLGGSFIRLANLANSEIIGTPTDLPWGFVFTRQDNIPRHPAQLYETLAYLISFGILWYFYRSNRFPLGKGFYFGLSILMIFISRFIIEFVKETQVAFEEQMVLDMGQWLSIPYILAGLGVLIYALLTLRNNRLGSGA